MLPLTCNVTDDSESNPRSSPWLCLKFFSLTKVSPEGVNPGCGRMRTFEGILASDGEDPHSRVFTVSVSGWNFGSCFILHSARIPLLCALKRCSCSQVYHCHPLRTLPMNSSADKLFILFLKVEGCPSGESAVSPGKRLHSAEEARCSSRPPPEGAGSVSITESEEKGGFCQQCQKKVSELKKQAQTLADHNSLKVSLESLGLITDPIPQSHLLAPYGLFSSWLH